MAALLLCAACTQPAPAQEARGAARAVDGDTLAIGGALFHLRGIDAPEDGQTCRWPDKEIPCGDLARWALMDLIAGAEVVCRPEGNPLADGGRVALCSAGGFDISGNMVHTGWALAVPAAAGDAYRGDQARARRNRHGMWKGEFTEPWDYRAQ